MDKLTCDVVEGAEIFRHESGKISHIVRRSPQFPAWWVGAVLAVGLTSAVGGVLYFGWQVAQWWMRALALCLVLVGVSPVIAAESLPAGQWVCVVASAYSPHDALDAEYHATKGAWRWRTADGTDVRSEPYGIAVPVAWLGRAVYVPAGQGYLDATRPAARWFRADDTGAIISRRTSETGLLHIDLRYRHEAAALRFGVRRVWVYVADEVTP